MRRKFRHDNAFKFFYRDAETAFPFAALPLGVGWRVPTGDVAGRDLRHVGAVMSGLFGPVGSARQSRADQTWRLQSATSQ
jgi:hypothetical protein